MPIEPARCQAIFDQVLHASRALGIADAEAILVAGSSALTRFANNAIHQNVAERSGHLSVRVQIDGRTARATTNRLDDASIRQVVEEAVALTKLQEPDPGLLPLAEPGGTGLLACPSARWHEATARVTPAERAQAVADAIAARQNLEDCDVGGIGGTLAGNALSLAAMRATLDHVLTQKAFDRMIPLAERWTAGVEQAIAEFDVPWHVTRLGCRAEYLFSPNHPRNGTEAHDAADFELERFMHLHAMNRGILLTPFHNMALMSPATEEKHIDRHTAVFREAVQALVP